MNKKLANIFKGDKVIWMVFFFLCIISVVEVFSASSELTYRNGSFLAPMVKHVGLLILGFFLMLVTLNVPCQYFKVATPFLILISIATLIIVFFIGRSTNGAQRWIPILGFQFQPSEIAKGTLVLATAQILSAMQTKDGCDRRAMQYILWVCLAIIPLIMMENLSTAALLCLVIFMMMFIGRVPGAQLGKLAGLVVILCVSIVTCVMVLGQDNSKELAANHLTEQTAKKAEQEESSGIFHRFDTWKSRIMKFSDGTEIPPEKVDLDKDAQTSYANVAIASSNIIGKGPGNSVARDFLSQAFSDFIYAIIIEEMGLVGAFFVAMLYIILLFRTGRIANRCERSFSAFLAMGLALLLVTQALFNMCVAVGLAPVTGQPLPLISKGGTSTIINCVYIGMILSISKSAKKNALSVEETSKATAVAA